MIHVTRERKLQNSKQRDESRFPYLGIHLVFSEIQRGISKIERRFQICHGFFKMFRPAYVNALAQKNRPGRPLHRETRRQIIDRYLTGDRHNEMTSFDIMERSVHVLRRLVKGDEVILLNF